MTPALSIFFMVFGSASQLSQKDIVKLIITKVQQKKQTAKLVHIVWDVMYLDGLQLSFQYM